MPKVHKKLKTLKKFNGRGGYRLGEPKTIYALAYSTASLIRLVHRAGFELTRNEVKVYWAQGTLGTYLNELVGSDPDRERVWFGYGDGRIEEKLILDVHGGEDE